MTILNYSEKHKISIDGGHSWKVFGDGLPYDTYEFALINNVIIAGGFNIYVSTNLGNTWELSSSGLPPYFLTEIFLFELEGLIFLGSSQYGVFISPDFGETWIQRNNGIDFKGLNKSVFNLINVGKILFLSTYSGIYKSTDLGETWFIKINGLEGNDYDQLMSLISMGNCVISGTNRAGNNSLYLSTDLGENWVKKNSSPFLKEEFYQVFSQNDKLFEFHSGDEYQDNGQMFLSTDSARTWENVTEDLLFKNNLIGNIDFISNQEFIYAAKCSELFRLEDNSNEWIQLLEQGINLGSVEILTSKGSAIFAGTDPFNDCLTHRAGLFLSEDFGDSWHPLGLEDYWVPSVCTAGNNIIAGTNHGVLISSDSGENWLEPNGIPLGIIAPLFVDNADNVFAASGVGVYFSSDNGLNWELRNNGFNKGHWTNSITSTGNYVIAGLDSGVWISPDLGLNWYEKNNGLPAEDRTVRSVFANGNTIFMCTRDNLYRSTDLGENWELKINGLNNDYLFVNDMEFINDNIFLASSYGIFLSSDNGESWIPKNQGLVDSDAMFTSLAVGGEYLFTGTNSEGFGTKGDKIYRAKISDLVTGIEDKYYSDPEFNFSIFPNPVINELNIAFKVTIKSTVSVEIYDILGKVVLREDFQLIGYDNEVIKVKLPDLSPGFYLSRINISGNVYSRSFVVLN